jgi:phosphomannomutase
MDEALRHRIERWIAEDIDETTKAELRAALGAGDEKDLEDRMAGPLEFGTAGLRGVLGAGPNRMNRAVVVRTSAGLARYVLANVPHAATRGVVVGFDGRRMSRELAAETAGVLAGAGVVAHLFPDLCTTPQTAFATAHLGAAAGIMVTASHNPPEYNGYKVYWENGAQIIPPLDRGIAEAIEQAPPANLVARMPLEQARAEGLVREVRDEVTREYLDRVAALSIRADGREGFRIAYTPMHGVGARTALAAFERAGFRDVVCVPEQVEPDGEFPTVRFPNPEEPGALELAFALATRERASLVIANDPDADRLAVAVPSRDARGWVQLTGNQVGILLACYLLEEHPSPPADRLVVTTVVSSPMLGAIAGRLGVRYAETLTGFKWIANKAMQIERATGSSFVFGYEEALGYTAGTVVRDKDGVSAAALFAELAAHHRAAGRSVLDALERIYRRHGLYLSRQRSVVHKGLDGAAEIRAAMSRLRDEPPRRIGSLEVEATRDYERGVRRTRHGGSTGLDMPASNVLAFELEGGSRVIARPSGTEPKIKFYFDVCERVDAIEPFAQAEARARAMLDGLEEAFVRLAG